MAKKKEVIPQYGTVINNGIPYFRTRITDADGKQVTLYGVTREELYQKEREARTKVAEITLVCPCPGHPAKAGAV